MQQSLWAAKIGHLARTGFKVVELHGAVCPYIHPPVCHAYIFAHIRRIVYQIVMKRFIANSISWSSTDNDSSDFDFTAVVGSGCY